MARIALSALLPVLVFAGPHNSLQPTLHSGFFAKHVPFLRKSNAIASRNYIASSDDIGDSEDKTFITGLMSGACAGITVDLVLYPLDTIKTRLQARAGANVVTKAAGKKFFDMSMFMGIYDGLIPAICASAPSAATFFGTYEFIKNQLEDKVEERLLPLVHLSAAAGGDLAQSVVRVPFEVVKQRLQAGVDSSLGAAIGAVLAESGPLGFYKGWGALALRDLPFDAIEFPLYEFFKYKAAEIKGEDLAPGERSLCGSAAGAVAAALTTPLDVAKTRIMTSPPGQYQGLLDCLGKVVAEEGVAGLFAGVAPRVGMISLGGAIFFGAYEVAKDVISARFENSGSMVENVQTA